MERRGPNKILDKNLADKWHKAASIMLMLIFDDQQMHEVRLEDTT